MLRTLAGESRRAVSGDIEGGKDGTGRGKQRAPAGAVAPNLADRRLNTFRREKDDRFGISPSDLDDVGLVSRQDVAQRSSRRGNDHQPAGRRIVQIRARRESQASAIRAPGNRTELARVLET